MYHGEVGLVPADASLDVNKWFDRLFPFCMTHSSARESMNSLRVDIHTICEPIMMLMNILPHVFQPQCVFTSPDSDMSVHQ